MKKLRFLIVPMMLVVLSGCAGVFIAGAATAVYVVTEPRSSRELASDQEISFTTSGLSNKAPFQFNVRVSASTFKGDVLLMGQAITQEYKDSFEAEVRKIDGVHNVYNQMKVKPLLSIGAISKDTWITTKVKSALFADDELRDIKITVYTEDTEVFLTGSVSPYHADKSVEIARNISGVSKVVRAFYYGEQEDAQAIQKAQTEEILTSPSPVTDANDEMTLPQDPSANEQIVEQEIPFIEPVEE